METLLVSAPAPISDALGDAFIGALTVIAVLVCVLCLLFAYTARQVPSREEVVHRHWQRVDESSRQRQKNFF